MDRPALQAGVLSRGSRGLRHEASTISSGRRTATAGIKSRDDGQIAVVAGVRFFVSTGKFIWGKHLSAESELQRPKGSPPPRSPLRPSPPPSAPTGASRTASTG